MDAALNQSHANGSNLVNEAFGDGVKQELDAKHLQFKGLD